MKLITLFTAFVVSTEAFSPMPHSRSSTSLLAKKVTKAKEDNRSLSRRIFDLDLFAPKANQNDYGARKSKNIKVGGLTKNSYVPNGLTKAQYEKVRRDEQRKKADNYERNVKKAGIFTDYTDWYKKTRN